MSLAMSEFSVRRLNGESVPFDLQILLEHSPELEKRTGIRIASETRWEPWSDTSYLTERDLKDPAIVANIKAIEKICSYIAFVAEHEDREYLGYWRGPSGRSIADSPLVWLDNEGQFSICAGMTAAEAILARHYEFAELKEWMNSIGVAVKADSIGEMRDTQDDNDPRDLHWKLQEEFLRQE